MPDSADVLDILRSVSNEYQTSKGDAGLILLSEVNAVIREIEKLQSEVRELKSEKSELVNRNRILRDRLDLPADKVHPRLAILDELDALRKERNNVKP